MDIAVTRQTSVRSARDAKEATGSVFQMMLERLADLCAGWAAVEAK